MSWHLSTVCSLLKANLSKPHIELCVVYLSVIVEYVQYLKLNSDGPFNQ